MDQAAAAALDLGHADCSLFEQAAKAPLVVAQPLAQRVFLVDIAEHQDDTDDGAVAPAYRRRRIGDLIFTAVARQQRCVVGQTDDQTGGQDMGNRIRHRPAGLGTDNREYLAQGLAVRFFLRPAGKLLGDDIEARDNAQPIGGDDGIANRPQGNGQVLAALIERA